MRALLTGATGTIGRRLVAGLADWQPRVLSRSVERARTVLGSVDAVAWDGRSPLPPSAFDGIDAVVHLAGEPVAEGRWSAAKKAAIRDSRVLSTRALVASALDCAAPPRVLVCASAVGFYGDRGDEELDESSAPGRGFLSEVCVEWERASSAGEAGGMRVVRLRLGVVLDREGGAFPQMVGPFRFGLGGPIGDGAQWMPWVHVDDVVGLIVHALTCDVSGALNAVAPGLLRQKEFAAALGRAVHRPAFLRTPKVALRLAFGEMADVLLASQRVSPVRTRASGYAFRRPELQGALESLVQGASSV
jgi:uncharacterized protein (TIGR01777 family)